MFVHWCVEFLYFCRFVSAADRFNRLDVELRADTSTALAQNVSVKERSVRFALITKCYLLDFVYLESVALARNECFIFTLVIYCDDYDPS